MNCHASNWGLVVDKVMLGLWFNGTVQKIGWTCQLCFAKCRGKTSCFSRTAVYVWSLSKQQGLRTRWMQQKPNANQRWICRSAQSLVAGPLIKRRKYDACKCSFHRNLSDSCELLKIVSAHLTLMLLIYQILPRKQLQEMWRNSLHVSWKSGHRKTAFILGWWLNSGNAETERYFDEGIQLNRTVPS